MPGPIEEDRTSAVLDRGIASPAVQLYLIPCVSKRPDEPPTGRADNARQTDVTFHSLRSMSNDQEGCGICSS